MKQNYADDARRAWTDLRPSGEAGNSSPALAGTCRRDRDPLVPGVQRIPGNEAADGWAKLAASDRTTRGRVAGACRRHPAARTTDLPSAPRAQGVGKEVAGSPLNRGYVLRKRGNMARPQPGRRNERPRGSTSSSPGMPSRGCTWRARITDRTTTAGGATRKTLMALARRETTCLSTVTSGKSNSPWCGRGSRKRQRRGSRSGMWATCWRTRGAAQRSSASCGAPTLGERPLQWRKAGTARARRRRRRRTERRSTRSSDPRAPGIGFLCNSFCPARECVC